MSTEIGLGWLLSLHHLSHCSAYEEDAFGVDPEDTVVVIGVCVLERQIFSNVNLVFMLTHMQKFIHNSIITPAALTQ